MRMNRWLGTALIFAVCSYGYAADEFSFGRLGVNVPPQTQSCKGVIKAMKPSVSLRGGMLTFENSHYVFNVATVPVLRLNNIYSKYADANCLTDASRLFFVWIDGKRFEDNDFVVKNVHIQKDGKKRTAVVSIEATSGEIAGRLVISVDDLPEARFGLSFVNKAKQTREFRAMFPYFENVQIGDSSSDNYYYFPYKGGMCSNKPYDLTSGYGMHSGSIQLLSLYNPTLGSGIYTRIEDEKGRTKTLLLRKKDDDSNVPVEQYKKIGGLFPEVTFEDRAIYPNKRGTTLACYSYIYKVESGAGVSLPTAILGIHGGDFSVAIEQYCKWIRTWFRHDIGTPQWFKDCYYYPVSHDISGNDGWNNGFIKDNKIAINEIAKPYEHIIQLAVWWDHAKDDHLGDKRDYSWYKHTIGDFDYEEEWGGAAALKKAFSKTREAGMRVSLYGATQWAVWNYSDVYEKHSDWAQWYKPDGGEFREYWWDINGQRLRYVNFCGQVEEWQDLCAQTNHRIIKDTGADGIYLDVMNQIPFCYNPKHKHEEYPTIAAEKMLRKSLAAVRSANSKAVVEVEDFCSDYLLQWTDGCWGKTFFSDLPVDVDTTFDLYSVSFIRFCFPEVKWTEFGPRWIRAGRRAFFNGMGYNISEVLNKDDPNEAKGITKEQRINYLIATCQLMKESSDVFSSTDVRCLVPTLQDRVYANYFGANGKKFYTIYNKNDSQVQGGVIKGESGDGYHCVELLYDNEVEYDGQTGGISLTVNPWEVVCVARFSNTMSLAQQGDNLDVTLLKSVKGGFLKLYIDVDDGKKQGERIDVRNNSARINLAKYQGKRLIIKLFKGDYLLDERIVELKMIATLNSSGDSMVSADANVQIGTDKFPGNATDWFGYAKYEFTVQNLDYCVVVPKKCASGSPWIWRAEFFGHEPQADLALLAKGWHLVYIPSAAGLYGSPEAASRWNKAYEYLTGQCNAILIDE